MRAIDFSTSFWSALRTSILASAAAASRHQETQRTGWLMHAEKQERHDIIMTESEMQKYGKRLWALQEKGFTVKICS